MTKPKPKSDNPAPVPAPDPDLAPAGTVAEEVAVVIDNPAQTAINTAQDAPETVEEVIEEHTPTTPAPVRGIDELFTYVEGMEQRLIKSLKPQQPEPERKVIEVTNGAAKEIPGSTDQSKPKRKRINIFHKRG